MHGVLERTREIGMVRAMGATQAQIRRMVLAEVVPARHAARPDVIAALHYE